MKRMKKIIVAILLACLCLALCACGKSGETLVSGKCSHCHGKGLTITGKECKWCNGTGYWAYYD